MLGPLHQALDKGGLTVPRRLAVAAGDRLAEALGAGDDPLLAQGWQDGPPLGDVTEDDPPLQPELDAPPEPVAAPEQAVSVPHPGGGQITVLLIGDSLIGGSLATAIVRGSDRGPPLRIVRAIQHGTGLSRPDLFDWLKVIPPLLERERPQFIVCSLGANDTQSLHDGERSLNLGDPRWREVYRERVVAMMQLLVGEQTRVLWLGLPAMRDRHFSERTRALNRVFAQAARSVPRVEFLDLNMLVSGPDGNFASFVTTTDGRFTRVRLDDGVHYSPAGARAIARWVLDWVHERIRFFRAPGR